MFRQWMWIGVLVLMNIPLWAQQDQYKNFEVEYKKMVSEQRVALVIGNGQYADIAILKNPVNDADSIAVALKECGFTVLQHTNLNRKKMFKAVRTFGESIESGGVGLFFYSGHGIQVAGKNYLVPVDADIQEEDEVETECLNMQLVLNKMKTAQNRVNIIILDACRDNPYADQYRSSGTSGGLAKMSAPKGTFIAYATAPNEKAIDGKGSNSPFTSALVKEMHRPGLSIADLLINVRNSVIFATKKRQTPWNSSSLTGKFYFRLPDSSIVEDTTVVRPETQLAQEKDVFSEKVGRYPSPMQVNNKKETDLHITANLKLPLLTESLLEQKAKVNARDEYGMTPLHVAAAKNAPEIVEILLNHGADINAKNKGGWKPLDYAMIPSNAHKTVEILRKHGADINAKDDYGRTRLHRVAEKNSHKMAKRLLEYGANPNVRDNDGATPLHWAAKANAHQTAEVLLKYEAKPDARKIGVGMTPLHVAAVFNSYQTAEVLIQYGANPDATSNSVTPLHVAAGQNAYKTAEVLLQYGANVNVRNNLGATPLWVAQIKEAHRTAELLRDNGGRIQ